MVIRKGINFNFRLNAFIIKKRNKEIKPCISNETIYINGVYARSCLTIINL